jgi:hypothetical protein
MKIPTRRGHGRRPSLTNKFLTLGQQVLQHFEIGRFDQVSIEARATS